MFVFCGQKEKKGLESNSFMSILDGLEGKKSQVFENEEHSVQFLKIFFFRNLFSWVKQYIEIDSILYLILLSGWVLVKGEGCC